MKVRTLPAREGTVLVSTDLHGNLEDFRALRDRFLAIPDAIWVSVGDWVHGPDDASRRRIRTPDGETLYDYPDETPQLLDELFALMDAHPGRVLSLLGNHEHAHIGGRRTSKFHEDEAAALEARMSAAKVDDMRARFASWPLFVCLPSAGVVITHACPRDTFDGPADLEALRYDRPHDRLLHSALWSYGFDPGGDERFLARMSAPGATYHLVIHGHDRDEDGFAPNGPRALLLCTSFGARRARKTYAKLDLSRPYTTLADLREGHELLRLHA